MISTNLKTNEGTGDELTLLELFKEVPKALQDTILSDEFEDSISLVARNYSLDEKEEIFLHNKALAVLLLVDTEEEFLENLRERFPDKDVLEMTAEIEESVFAPTKKKLESELLETTPNTTLDRSTPIKEGEINIDQTIQNIGVEYGLRVDELGLLREEINKRVEGEKAVSDFARDVEAVLPLEKDKRDKLLKDVNEKIFVRIRERMKESNISPELEEGLDREQILKEIESGETKPETRVSPVNIDSDKSFLRGNIEKQKDSPSVTNTTETVISVPQKTEGELFEQKLRVEPPVKTKPVEDTYKGGADPYREPIN